MSKNTFFQLCKYQPKAWTREAKCLNCFVVSTKILVSSKGHCTAVQGHAHKTKSTKIDLLNNYYGQKMFVKRAKNAGDFCHPEVFSFRKCTS